MRVIDASVGVKWLIPEVDSDRALALYGEHLIAPDLFSTEVANALHTAERSGRIKDAQILLGDLLIYLPTLHGAVSLLPRALEIATQTGRSTYDALYISLAEREECELVTADSKLVNAVQKDFPFVISLNSIPL